MQYLRCFLGGGAVTLLVTDRFFNIVKVEGVSMQPTLNPSGRWDERDIVLVDKRKCMTYDFERGDVVTIDLHPNKRIVKRIVGLGGDWIRSNRKDSEEEGSWDGEKKVVSGKKLFGRLQMTKNCLSKLTITDKITMFTVTPWEGDSKLVSRANPFVPHMATVRFFLRNMDFFFEDIFRINFKKNKLYSMF